MGIEGFWKKGKDTLKAGALAAGLLAGADNADASQKAIAEAKARVELAEFDLENAKTPEAKLIAKRKLIEAEQGVKIAEAEDKDERARVGAFGVGVAPKNTSETVVTHRVVDILDKDGKVIGRAMEGSKEWKELEELRIKADRDIEKAKAKASEPAFGYDRRGVYGGTSRGPARYNFGRVSPQQRANPDAGRYRQAPRPTPPPDSRGNK